MLTVLCYLNPQWDPKLGGALRLHAPSGPVDLCPAGGRIAMFWSDQMPHEVCARGERRALVGSHWSSLHSPPIVMGVALTLTPSDRS